MAQLTALDRAVDEELGRDRHHGPDQYRLARTGQARESPRPRASGRDQNAPDLAGLGPAKPRARPHGDQTASRLHRAE